MSTEEIKLQHYQSREYQLTEHECKYPDLNVTLTEISGQIKEILGHQTDMKTTLQNLDTTIRGNGKEGLKTQVALNRQAIKRMWWAVGGVFIAFAGMVVRSLLQ